MHNQILTALEDTLSPHLDLSKSRLRTLAWLIVGMVNARTVNLSHIASQFCGDVQVSSSYRRLQRFFQYVRLDGGWLALVVVRLMKANPPWRLCLDRTNWKIGKRDVNILMLALLTRRARIPLMWTILNKAGNSSSTERIGLMRRYLALFGAGSIKLLLCDREFIGQNWIAFLQKHQIPFVIRVKKSAHVRFNDGRVYPLHCLIHKPCGIARLKQLRGHLIAMAESDLPPLAFAAKRLVGGNILVVATNTNPQTALEAYRKRWLIECLFADSKKRGLNMEDTRLSNPKKLNTLLVVMALAMAWAYACATASQGTKPIRTKKHGYRYKSWFRIGFDQLRKWILHKPDKVADIWKNICPKRIAIRKITRVV